METISHDIKNKLERNAQSRIFRIKTGHSKLKVHLLRTALADSATCRCGATKQHPEHIMRDWPDLGRQREEVWSSGVTLRGKLWEPAITSDAPSFLFMTHAGIESQQTLITKEEAGLVSLPYLSSVPE